MRARGSSLFAALAMVFGTLSVTGAAPSADAFFAEFGTTATLVRGGEAVRVSIRVACPLGADILEAFVYVISEEGASSQFAPVRGIRCDGKAKNHIVQVQAYEDAPLRTGTARASGYILIDSGRSLSPTAVIQIRGS